MMQQAGAELCQAQIKLGLDENKMEAVFHLWKKKLRLSANCLKLGILFSLPKINVIFCLPKQLRSFSNLGGWVI